MIGEPTLYDYLFCLLTLGVAQAFVLIPRVSGALRVFAPSALGRVFVGVLIGFSAIYACSKNGISPRAYVAQFVTALAGGGIIDESGIVGRSSEAAVIEAYAGLSVEIADSASNTVAAAADDFRDVAGLVTNAERRVIYIASDLPRAYSRGWTNHNISANVERVRQSDGGTNCSMWVWFSETPAIAPVIAAEVDLGAGWFKLDPVTNSYPQTEAVNGVPCVRYDYALPVTVRGVVYRPDYEVQFGHPSSPLLVPRGGILVETNGTGGAALPFTGTDRYFSGRVEVDYRGGIATALRLDGVPKTNTVVQL